MRTRILAQVGVIGSLVAVVALVAQVALFALGIALYRSTGSDEWDRPEAITISIDAGGHTSLGGRPCTLAEIKAALGAMQVPATLADPTQTQLSFIAASLNARPIRMLVADRHTPFAMLEPVFGELFQDNACRMCLAVDDEPTRTIPYPVFVATCGLVVYRDGAVQEYSRQGDMVEMGKDGESSRLRIATVPGVMEPLTIEPTETVQEYMAQVAEFERRGVAWYPRLRIASTGR